jgi:hypothetical protein
MEYQLGFNIEISFTLTDEEFKIVTDSIQEGEKSYEATIGQFWYGNMNRRLLTPDGEKENIFYSASTRQMDTIILKSLEKFVTFRSNQDRWKIGAELYHKLYKILKNAVDFSNCLNIHSATKEIK